jgi:hypothetical protein
MSLAQQPDNALVGGCFLLYYRAYRPLAAKPA